VRLSTSKIEQSTFLCVFIGNNLTLSIISRDAFG
jgi:hypothetical protein